MDAYLEPLGQLRIATRIHKNLAQAGFKKKSICDAAQGRPAYTSALSINAVFLQDLYALWRRSETAEKT